MLRDKANNCQNPSDDEGPENYPQFRASNSSKITPLVLAHAFASRLASIDGTIHGMALEIQFGSALGRLT
jgi:hypothetical protein